MGLLEVFRSGVKVVDKVTKPLQTTVSFTRYVSSDSYGTVASPPAVVSLRAIVELKKKQIKGEGGVIRMSRVTIIFLDIVALVAATNGLGVQALDTIVLSDGSTGPILDTGGFIDAGTGIPIATEVFLG